MNDYPELNVDLLDKTLDHIRTLEAFRAEGVETDETWDQACWAKRTECGTAMCFAGWAVTLAGHQLVPEKTSDCGCPVCVENVSRFLVVEMSDGVRRRVEDVATEVLGLTGPETDLFEADNTLERLSVYVEKIKAGSYRQEVA